MKRTASTLNLVTDRCIFGAVGTSRFCLGGQNAGHSAALQGPLAGSPVRYDDANRVSNGIVDGLARRFAHAEAQAAPPNVFPASPVCVWPGPATWTRLLQAATARSSQRLLTLPIPPPMAPAGEFPRARTLGRRLTSSLCLIRRTGARAYP